MKLGTVSFSRTGILRDCVASLAIFGKIKNEVNRFRPIQSQPDIALTSHVMGSLASDLVSEERIGTSWRGEQVAVRSYLNRNPCTDGSLESPGINKTGSRRK